MREAVLKGEPGIPLAELPAPPGARPSAVLVPVFEDGGEAHVVLTRRGSWLRSHSSQVAFPGGRVEPGETPEEAALREAYEEVALDPASVEVVGPLTPIATLSAVNAIEPFVGVLPARPALVANPAEVERVFDVPFSELLDLEVFREERWGIAGVERPMYFFELDGETVWGATARILFELLVRLTTVVR